MEITEFIKPLLFIEADGEKYCCDLSVDITGNLEEQGCTKITEAFDRDRG